MGKILRCTICLFGFLLTDGNSQPTSKLGHSPSSAIWQDGAKISQDQLSSAPFQNSKELPWLRPCLSQLINAKTLIKVPWRQNASLIHSKDSLVKITLTPLFNAAFTQKSSTRKMENSQVTPQLLKQIKLRKLLKLCKLSRSCKVAERAACA